MKEDPAIHPPAQGRIRIVVAGAVGNVLEWYDFALFGYFAPVFAHLYFPSGEHLAALLQTYGVFALGFLMRPLGGAFFGHVGDRMGRTRALQLSVLLMALPTTALGLLPTYAQIGPVAPLLLTAIRLLQGFSVGGELVGSMSFLGEYSAPGRRGLVGSWSVASASLGTLMGSAIAAILTATLAPDDLARWGWRLPFLAGVLVGGVGLWLRRGIDETPSFKAAEGAGEIVHAPVREVLTRGRRAVRCTLAISLLMSVAFYLTFVWLATWLAHINRPPLRDALVVNTLALGLLIVLNPAAGALSDRFGRRPVLLAAAGGWILAGYPVFVLLRHGTFASALAGQGLFALFTALACGPSPAVFVEAFPTAVRYSGIALSYNTAMAVFGGTTPMVATWLIAATGYPLAPAFLVAAAAAVAAVAVWGMEERYDRPLQ